MVPDDVRDQRAIRVQLETTKRPAPRIDAVHLPELPRIGRLRPTRVFPIQIGRWGDQQLDPAVVLVDRAVVMPRDDPTDLGIALQEGEECCGILQATRGHGTHWEGTMVQANQGRLARGLLERLLKCGEFPGAEGAMILLRHLRVEEHDLPRVPDHTAFDVNRPAFEVDVHRREDVMIARNTVHREP